MKNAINAIENKTTEKKGISTKELCLSAIFAALTFVITRFIQIPIPLGYFNVGNCIILACCTLLPSPCGIFVGAIGSALADLTSYPVYTIPTLIIKALMPFIYYLLCKLNINNKFVKCLIAGIISMLIPLFGYTITGGILYGGFVAGLAQFPGLLLEYVANCILFATFLGIYLKTKKTF